jgi:hypothetical protein
MDNYAKIKFNYVFPLYEQLPEHLALNFFKKYMVENISYCNIGLDPISTLTQFSISD